MKTFLVMAAIVSGWVAMAADVMRRNDDHMMKVMTCMKETRHAMMVSSQEAYVICEKEAK